jgi:hypothetical protein
MKGKERRKYGVAQRLDFRKVGDTRARHWNHSMRIPILDVASTHSKSRSSCSYRVRVMPVSSTFFRCFMTNSTGLTGGLHEMKSTLPPGQISQKRAHARIVPHGVFVWQFTVIGVKQST